MKDSSPNKKGVIILVAFILLAILGSLSVTFIYLVKTNTSSTTNWFLQRQAQILSENGLNLAIANLIKRIQDNPYLINESDILTKDSDIDYKKIFTYKIAQLVSSSISKYKQKFFGKEHKFAMLTKDDKKNFGVKVFIKDASGKINAINPSSSAFRHFLDNFTSDKKIELNVDFSSLYTEKFPYDLKKYFSLYPARYNLFKYSNPDNKGLDEYEKFKNYFQKSFEFEDRAFININTADTEIIAYNLSGSETVISEYTPCGGANTKKNEVFFEEAFKVLQRGDKTICRTDLKLKKTKKTSISKDKAKIIAEYIVQKRNQIQGWKSYKELFASIKNDLKNRLTNDEIELLISLIHPKILLSQLHNYKNIRKSLDKINITKGGFEFSFSSDGFFEIYSAGLIFTSKEILAQETTFKLTKVFSKELLLGYKNLKDKTVIAANVDFYPYSKINLPVNAFQLDGFVSLAKLYDFCKSEEGRIFKYTLADNTYLEKMGLYDIVQQKNIINPKELSLFITKEGMYIPPYFSLLTNIDDKTMQIKLLDKQEGDMPFCSAFSSVRPYIYLLNNLGINIVFKTLKESQGLSFEFTNGNIINFKSQILNTTLIDNNLQFWFIDYPLTVEKAELNINRLSESQWHMLSYYYYYKINQIKRGKPTEERFNIFTRIDNQNINMFPKENELYINTVFFENLFQNQTTLSIGGNLFPLTNSGIFINGLCLYKALNYYENFYPPYQKKGLIQIFNPQTGYKTITNVYYFGDEISVENLNGTKITKINFNFTNEDSLPILDIIEYLTFSNIQFIESY